ncbi:hypothetical protein AB0I60_37220 [Actinosynnema sp. NPDC050436]|uniref:hypothetical protein n=1 Tax=Actinosynnema sp. NPDC050436 TaxID=3155659 RepID=UPI0033E7AA84
MMAIRGGSLPLPLRLASTMQRLRPLPDSVELIDVAGDPDAVLRVDASGDGCAAAERIATVHAMHLVG